MITSITNNSYLMDANYNPSDPATKKTFLFMESDPYNTEQQVSQTFPLKLYSERETILEVHVTASNQILASQGWVIGSCNAYIDAASTYASSGVDFIMKSGDVIVGDFNIQDNQDYYYTNE